MKLKRIALVVLAAVLISALSVAGTMALLTQKANDGTAVINTFQSYAIGSNTNKPLATTFTLQEHEAVKQADGSYTLNTANEVYGNDYKLMPGVVVKKDPFVTIAGKTEAPARLFVEVVDELPACCDWDMDADKWEAVMASDNTQMTGAKGGKLYVCKDILARNDKNNGTFEYNIIEGNKITVDNYADLSSLADTRKNLTFYAYLAQATVVVKGENSNAPADIYDVCFLASPGGSNTNP